MTVIPVQDDLGPRLDHPPSNPTPVPAPAPAPSGPAAGGKTNPCPPQPQPDGNGGADEPPQPHSQRADSISQKRAQYLWNASANAVADPPPGGDIPVPAMGETVVQAETGKSS